MPTKRLRRSYSIDVPDHDETIYVTDRKMDSSLRSKNGVRSIEEGGRKLAHDFEFRLNFHKGYEPQEINVSVEKDDLIIQAEHKGQLKNEQIFRKFKRIIPLPQEIDKTSLIGGIKNGHLAIIGSKLIPNSDLENKTSENTPQNPDPIKVDLTKDLQVIGIHLNKTRNQRSKSLSIDSRNSSKPRRSSIHVLAKSEGEKKMPHYMTPIPWVFQHHHELLHHHYSPPKLEAFFEKLEKRAGQRRPLNLEREEYKS